MAHLVLLKELSQKALVLAALGIISLPLTPAHAESKTDKKAHPGYDARVVMVFDRECSVWCGEVKPILSSLQSEYKKVEFVSLDTSKEGLPDSKSTAKTMGISKFLSENVDYAPVIGVFSAKGKLVKELVGPKKKEIYLAAISQALSAK